MPQLGCDQDRIGEHHLVAVNINQNVFSPEYRQFRVDQCGERFGGCPWIGRQTGRIDEFADGPVEDAELLHGGEFKRVVVGAILEQGNSPGFFPVQILLSGDDVGHAQTQQKAALVFVEHAFRVRRFPVGGVKNTAVRDPLYRDTFNIAEWINRAGCIDLRCRHQTDLIRFVARTGRGQ